MNDTTSYNKSFIDLCCHTRRVMFMCRRLVFVTRRLTFMSRILVFVTRRVMFMSRRLVFVTGRLTFMSRRIVFVTSRVQKCSYIKFSKSLIFVSSSKSPTGILFPQSIHLCYIGVL